MKGGRTAGNDILNFKVRCVKNSERSRKEEMKQIILLTCVLVLVALSGIANNIRVDGNVKVLAADVDERTGVATVRFTVKWDNSWRDAFNYDGVYLFFKYKLEGEEERWHHAYLADEGNISNTSGYNIYMKNSLGVANCCEGVFIHRSLQGKGDSEVALELKWQINSNRDRVVMYNDFVTGAVSLSAMGVELVYMPRGAFRAGDSKSNMTFKNKRTTIPSDKDILAEGKYKYTSFAQSVDEFKTKNPPEFAINRINDPGKTTTNAWLGKSVGTGDWWAVEFDEAKTIRNIAIESIEGHTPLAWELQGTSGSDDWVTLYRGTGDDWITDSRRTYPCTHAIHVTASSAYRSIRILITSTNQSVAIKNVAMTTENIFNDVDNSVLIFDDTTLMDNRVGLFAEDGDTEWTGYTPVAFPNGYSAFWAMKYELSQEQYVAFLNKLTTEQQKVRTLAAAFESLEIGDYVFGADKKRSSSRNGIKLASRGQNGRSHLFVNDLDSRDGYDQNGDGQTLACNFLNAGDMMAYADWSGLRPLSELEYEKMARRPYPDPAIWNEYAWNTNTIVVSSDVNTIGEFSKTEKPLNGYVNAENKIGGPIRCGSYAASKRGQTEAGSSFWGVMELSGNIAELYYNANKEGQAFQANESQHHGDGKLSPFGYSNVSNSFWPISAKAFALRGGSFKSETSELAISDRSRHWGVYTEAFQVSEQRDSTIGFRLGATAPRLIEKSEVRLQNGLTSASIHPYDTICSGDDYVIRGSVPSSIKGAYQITWFKSEDGGVLWDVISGEEDPNLHLSNLRNINEETYFFKEFQFKRIIYSNEVAGEQSQVVSVWVVNHDVYFSSYRDTVDVYSYSNGITVMPRQEADIKWYWLRPTSGHRELDIARELPPPSISSELFFRYGDFNDGIQIVGQDVDILMEARVMGKCIHRDTLHVYLKPQPEKQKNRNDALTENLDFKCGNILIDNEVEGNDLEYTTIRIGNRCWFAENLRRPTADLSDSKCYDDIEANCDKFGRLYHWNAAVSSWNNSNIVKGICPAGWHIPTDAEWNQLRKDAGGPANLSSQLNPWTWNPTTDKRSNKTRFSALPTGAHTQNAYSDWWGGFNGYAFNDILAIWWSSNYYNNTHVGWYGNQVRYANIPYTTYIQYNERANSQNGYLGVGWNQGIVSGVSVIPGTRVSYSAGWFDEREHRNSINYAFGGDNYEVIYERYHLPVRCIKNGIEK